MLKNFKEVIHEGYGFERGNKIRADIQDLNNTKSMDLSNFSFEDITTSYVRGIFDDCPNLKEIIVDKSQYNAAVALFKNEISEKVRIIWQEDLSINELKKRAETYSYVNKIKVINLIYRYIDKTKPHQDMDSIFTKLLNNARDLENYPDEDKFAEFCDKCGAKLDIAIFFSCLSNASMTHYAKTYKESGTSIQNYLVDNSMSHKAKMMLASYVKLDTKDRYVANRLFKYITRCSFGSYLDNCIEVMSSYLT